MPIDEKIENLDSEKNKNSQQSTMLADAKYFFGIYAKAIKKISLINKSIIINSSLIEEFADYLKFDNEMQVKIRSLPTSKVLEIINEADPDLYKLLTNTNLKNLIEDDFNIKSDHPYQNIPKELGIRETIKASSLMKFLDTASEYLVIPDLSFASAFISEGDRLRRYAQKITEPDKLLLRMKANTVEENNIYEIFSPTNLHNYYQKTKDPQITNMINETNELIDILMKKSGSGTNIRTELYQRLKKNNSGLVVQYEE